MTIVTSSPDPMYYAKSATLTSTTIALVSGVICPVNSARRGLVIFNNSVNSCYISLAATSVASTCSYILATFATLSLLDTVIYTGVLSAIRNAGTGNIAVWELS